MTHALIIDDNMAVSRGIQQRLQALGFDSFDHTWSERQTLEAAARRRPDLIVIGDAISEGSPVQVAKQVSLSSHAPVLALTSDRFMFNRSIPAGASVGGPYKLSDLDVALGSALMVA